MEQLILPLIGEAFLVILLNHAQGRRTKVPAGGIPLTVVHWKRGGA